MTPPIGLRWKLIGSYLILVAAVLVAVVILTRYSITTIFASYQEALLVRDGQALAHFFGRDYTLEQDWTKVAPDFTASTRFDRNDIWIMNGQGQPVLRQPTTAPTNERPPAKSVAAALAGNVVTGENQSLLGAPRQLWAAVPIRADTNTVVGVVYVVASPDSMPIHALDDTFPFRFIFIQGAADFVTNVEERLAATGLIVGVLAIGLGVWLARSITDPIHELRHAVGRIAAGDLSQRVRVRSRDEVGSLAEDINRMAVRLEADVNELRRQEALRRDLVANVSHDLATPLTSIQGFTEALMDGVVSDDAQRGELYGSVYREVHRLRRLVGDLQNLSALENGMGHIQPQALKLDELAEEALKVEFAEAAERGVALRQEIAPDVPPVLADGDRVTQVLLNLIDNALRFTPTGGTITVGSRVLPDEVEVSIADTGAGIPPDELPQIFERFYRVDRSRSRETGGGGLGLAIVKAIVAAHGGRVAATSALGTGTDIRFTLPRVIEATGKASAQSAKPRPARPRSAPTPVAAE